MTRSEILGLSKLEEKKAWDTLYAEGVLKEVRRFSLILEKYIDVVESLDDLAGRLWRDKELNNGKLQDSLIEIWKLYGKASWYYDDEPDYVNVVEWFLYCSLPIHRIQAALLAKESPK